MSAWRALAGPPLPVFPVRGAGAAAPGSEFLGQASEGAVQAGDILTGVDTAATAGGIVPAAEAAGGVAGMATQPGGIPAAMGGAPAATGGFTQGAQNAATSLAKETAKEPGWLSKAATAAMDFAKSPTGGTVIGSMISGAGAGMQQNEQNKFDSRVERMFADPNDPGVQALQNHDYSVNTPRGLSGASSEYARRLAENSGRYTPNVPFRRPITQPGG